MHVSIAFGAELLDQMENIPYICARFEEDDRMIGETRDQRIARAMSAVNDLANIKAGSIRVLIVFMVDKDQWNATIGSRPPAILVQSWKAGQIEQPLPLVYHHASPSYDPSMADIANAHLACDYDTITAFRFEPPQGSIRPPGSSFSRSPKPKVE